jgi:hypothetical protein
MEQPVFVPKDGDLEARISDLFAEPDAAARAHEIVARYDEDGSSEGTDRVRIAALYLSKGDLEKLEDVIALANTDYRDVIAAAEYRAYLELPTEASAEDRQFAIEADWNRYGSWVGH